MLVDLLYAYGFQVDFSDNWFKLARDIAVGASSSSLVEALSEVKSSLIKVFIPLVGMATNFGSSLTRCC